VAWLERVPIGWNHCPPFVSSSYALYAPACRNIVKLSKFSLITLDRTTPMREARQSKARRLGEATGKLGTAKLTVDGFPGRSARAPLALRPSSPPLLQPAIGREKASIALHNLRGLAIVFVLMTHTSLAYVASAQAQPYPFDHPPYGWLTFPILDPRHWLGFDVFCAWQDVYLMSLWFFLSGVFTWRSIERDGELRFLTNRLLRLGAPLLFGVLLLMPVALYPAYRVTAADPSLAGYAREYLALPFAPCGPLWFLWLLLAFTLATAALHRFARRTVPAIGNLSRQFERRPFRTFAVWTVVCVVAYAPLALVFTPWRWSSEGPVAIQLCRPLLYAVYYCAGLGVGTAGLGAGMLRADGVAASKWAVWMAAAVASLAVWLGLTALALRPGWSAPPLLRAAGDASFALAGACSVVFILAICLRFGATDRWPLLARLSDNALGVYVLHYAPVVWLQYALLGLAWPAPLKAALVLCGATAACMMAIAAARSLRSSVGTRLSSRWVFGS
jgi:surface polysaccharide O-acyltransferase-like enzyme